MTRHNNNIFAFIANHSFFQRTVIGLILFNSVLLGFETVQTWYNDYYSWFHFFDQLLLWLFTVEIVIRFLAARPFYSFFKDGWNWFDFLIVASGHIFAGAQFVTVLRIMRLLRVFRAFSVIPSLRKMVNALLMTIPALGNILLLMSLIFYIFAVAGTTLFGQAMPDMFGNLGVSLLTLFQVVTLESWATGVMYPVIEEFPYAWIYFVLFVLMGTFVIFNLFVGVIVNNVEKATDEDDPDGKETKRENPFPTAEIVTRRDVDVVRREISSLQAEIRELKDFLKDKR